MRDFFKKEVLDRTYEIFGVRQTDEEKMSDNDIKFLLDGLCQVSKTYAYIPEEDQKKIIRGCMLSDKTYRNINLRLVAGWLELNGKKFFTESSHKQQTADPNYVTVQGEDRDKWLEIWQQTLKQVEENFPSQRVQGSGSRLRENLNQIAPPKEPSALDEFCTTGTNELLEESKKKEETIKPDSI